MLNNFNAGRDNYTGTVVFPLKLRREPVHVVLLGLNIFNFAKICKILQNYERCQVSTGDPGSVRRPGSRRNGSCT